MEILSTSASTAIQDLSQQAKQQVSSEDSLGILIKNEKHRMTIKTSPSPPPNRLRQINKDDLKYPYSHVVSSSKRIKPEDSSNLIQQLSVLIISSSKKKGKLFYSN